MLMLSQTMQISWFPDCPAGHRYNAGLSTSCNHSELWEQDCRGAISTFLAHSLSTQFLNIWLFEEDCTSWFYAIKIRVNTAERTQECIFLSSYLWSWRPCWWLLSEYICDRESLTIKPTRENCVINKSPAKCSVSYIIK